MTFKNFNTVRMVVQCRTWVVWKKAELMKSKQSHLVILILYRNNIYSPQISVQFDSRNEMLPSLSYFQLLREKFHITSCILRISPNVFMSWWWVVLNLFGLVCHINHISCLRGNMNAQIPSVIWYRRQPNKTLNFFCRTTLLL